MGNTLIKKAYTRNNPDVRQYAYKKLRVEIYLSWLLLQHTYSGVLAILLFSADISKVVVFLLCVVVSLSIELPE